MKYDKSEQVVEKEYGVITPKEIKNAIMGQLGFQHNVNILVVGLEHIQHGDDKMVEYEEE